MHFRHLRSRIRCVAAGALATALVTALVTFGGPAHADEGHGDLGMQILDFLGIGVSGYWFTSGSADDALGSPKFLSNTTFYVKPTHKGPYSLTGGYQDLTIKDHWQPYSGGNRFEMQGAAFKLMVTKRDRYDWVPYVNGGIFFAHIHSDKQDFKKDEILPSIAFGVEKEVVRYVKFKVGYRLTPSIGGVNTSGGFVGISLF